MTLQLVIFRAVRLFLRTRTGLLIRSTSVLRGLIRLTLQW